jgi:hypothetical protein
MSKTNWNTTKWEYIELHVGTALQSLSQGAPIRRMGSDEYICINISTREIYVVDDSSKKTFIIEAMTLNSVDIIDTLWEVGRWNSMTGQPEWQWWEK